MSKKEDNLARYNQSFEQFFPEYFFFSFNFAPWRMTIRGLMDYEKVKQQ